MSVDTSDSGASSASTLLEHFDARAATFDATPWANDMEVYSRFESMIDFRSKKTIVDLGGGTGLLGDHFRRSQTNASVLNVDISPQMVRRAQSKGVPSVVADVCFLPFKESCFDIAILRQVLQYVPTPIKALHECHRVLRPGGQLLIGQFVPYDLQDQILLKNILKSWQPLKENLPTAAELDDLLREASFRTVSTSEKELTESLSFWLERYHVPLSKQHAAISTALRAKNLFTSRRKIFAQGDDILFTNLFFIINAVK